MQQRAANCKTERLDGTSTVPIVLEVTEITMTRDQYRWSREKVKSSQHDLISYLMCSNFEQMHRGDHFIYEHPSNASSWNALCVQKFVPQQCVFQIEGPICRWHLLYDESGFTRELVSWLTNHPDLAEALEQ